MGLFPIRVYSTMKQCKSTGIAKRVRFPLLRGGRTTVRMGTIPFSFGDNPLSDIEASPPASTGTLPGFNSWARGTRELWKAL